MKKEELIKKLESVKLPEIELQSHQRRLRMALLDAGYLQRRPRVTIWGLAKSKVKGGIDTMIQGLVSRQPVWKTVVAGVLAVVLIAGLALALPLLTGQTPEVLAAEIAKQDPRVQTFLAKGATLEEVVPEGELYSVTFKLPEYLGQGLTSVKILVDIDEARVVVLEVEGAYTRYLPGGGSYTHLPLLPLTEEQRERAIEIAKGDPRVQGILEGGATVLGVGSTIDGLVEVTLLQEDREGTWEVMVDLDKGEVYMILDGAPMVPPTARPITEAEREEAINIAKADPRVQGLLDKGAEIDTVTGCFRVGKVEIVELEDGRKTIALSPVTMDKIKVMVKLPGEEYLTVVRVDLAEGKVVNITPEP